MLFFIVQHRSVQFTYGLVVALPLVLVSLEPFVWRREDHAVPKDSYFVVRVAEFVVMWILILRQQPEIGSSVGSEWFGCETLALVSTFGLYVTLPFVWKHASKLALSRDFADWADDGTGEGLQAEEGSEYGSDQEDRDDRMPGE